MAWRMDQRKICPTCRTRKEEWERDRDHRVGHIEVCPGCAVLEQEQQNAQELKQKGVKIGLVPKEMATSGEELGA